MERKWSAALEGGRGDWAEEALFPGGRRVGGLAFAGGVEAVGTLGPRLGRGQGGEVGAGKCIDLLWPLLLLHVD